MSNNKDIDLLGIGNAITDILVKVDYQFIEKMKFNIGTMQLTDYETINKTINLFNDRKVSAGGSVANTASMVSTLVTHVHLLEDEKMMLKVNCLVKACLLQI